MTNHDSFPKYLTSAFLDTVHAPAEDALRMAQMTLALHGTAAQRQDAVGALLDQMKLDPQEMIHQLLRAPAHAAGPVLTVVTEKLGRSWVEVAELSDLAIFDKLLMQHDGDIWAQHLIDSGWHAHIDLPTEAPHLREMRWHYRMPQADSQPLLASLMDNGLWSVARVVWPQVQHDPVTVQAALGAAVRALTNRPDAWDVTPAWDWVRTLLDAGADPCRNEMLGARGLERKDLKDHSWMPSCPMEALTLAVALDPQPEHVHDIWARLHAADHVAQWTPCYPFDTLLPRALSGPATDHPLRRAALDVLVHAPIQPDAMELAGRAIQHILDGDFKPTSHEEVHAKLAYASPWQPQQVLRLVMSMMSEQTTWWFDWMRSHVPDIEEAVTRESGWQLDQLLTSAPPVFTPSPRASALRACWAQGMAAEEGAKWTGLVKEARRYQASPSIRGLHEIPEHAKEALRLTWLLPAATAPTRRIRI